MKFIRNRSLTNPAFNDDLYSSNYVFLCFLPFYRTTLKRKEKKRRRKTNKNKQTNRKLHRPGFEPGISRSPVLHFTTGLMHKLRNYTEKKSYSLNNAD